MTIISLLRDYGFQIFEVPMFIACGIGGLATMLSIQLRDRVLLKALADGQVGAGDGSLAGGK